MENKTPRVILLGASNVTRGISIAIETARSMFSSAIDIYVAAGHGRSYGIETSVLSRRLVGITECELWQTLKSEPNRPTYALITDIGNDLLYGVSTCQITSWVEECIDRLSQFDSTIHLTSLPVENLHSLGNLRYLPLRTLLFPRCRLSLEEIRTHAFDLNDQVIQTATKHSHTIIKPQSNWYGIDPIHIQRSFFCKAWQEFLILWKKNKKKSKKIKGSLQRWIYLQSRAPLKRRLLGFSHNCTQPAASFYDGTTISFF